MSENECKNISNIKSKKCGVAGPELAFVNINTILPYTSILLSGPG